MMLYAIYERCASNARKPRKSMILATEASSPDEIAADARTLWRTVTGRHMPEVHIRAMGALGVHERAEVELSTGK